MGETTYVDVEAFRDGGIGMLYQSLSLYSEPFSKCRNATRNR